MIQSHSDGVFTGPLADELSGIYNWVMSISGQEAEDVLRHPKIYVPSLPTVASRGVSSNSIAGINTEYIYICYTELWCKIIICKVWPD